ncbi:choice-of-anchor A family protein [Variovorax sp. HJSM1_2]|uniref:choice-of-anchor A family protein n=1 Tax=Variovorax sp. HJSM1_2 TaxID=3366263 RepID=UPI003BE8E605
MISPFLMFTSVKKISFSVLFVTALSAVGVAQAAPVGLGLAGEFNLVSLNDFNASNASIQGAVAVGGNFTASGYSINGGNDAYAGDALVVGGNLSFKNGSISNGNVAVGGSKTTSGLGFSGVWESGAASVPFAQLAADMANLSTSLSTLGSTGQTAIQWGGMSFTGSNSAVEVFNVAGADLYSVTYSSLSQLAAGSTIILNISGDVAGFKGGTPNAFGNYNVLYNFYEATDLNFDGVGIVGSILAPFATVSGGSGQINGNVVVGAWESNIAINNSHGFTTTEVAAFEGLDRGTADKGGNTGNVVNSVPEPGSLALMLLAFAAAVMSSMRAGKNRRVPQPANI